MKFSAKWIAAALLAGLPLAAAAEQTAPSLPALAGSADLVALAQVRDTDYLRRRDIPVSGSAYLRILIPYKQQAAMDLVEVYEKGLHDNECYFPNPTVFEEGRRYLLFLRRDPDDPERYRGLSQGCAVDVLVDRDNRYVVRMPVTGLDLAAADRQRLEALARPVAYGDAYAIVADEDLPPARRDAMRAAGLIEPWSDESETGEDLIPPFPSEPRQWIYTQGVPLGEFRELLQLENHP